MECEESMVQIIYVKLALQLLWIFFSPAILSPIPVRRMIAKLSVKPSDYCKEFSNFVLVISHQVISKEIRTAIEKTTF